MQFIFAWPAVFTMDTYGRRTLLIFTFPNMFWTLLGKFALWTSRNKYTVLTMYDL